MLMSHEHTLHYKLKLKLNLYGIGRACDANKIRRVWLCKPPCPKYLERTDLMKPRISIKPSTPCIQSIQWQHSLLLCLQTNGLSAHGDEHDGLVRPEILNRSSLSPHQHSLLLPLPHILKVANFWDKSTTTRNLVKLSEKREASRADDHAATSVKQPNSIQTILNMCISVSWIIKAIANILMCSSGDLLIRLCYTKISISVLIYYTVWKMFVLCSLQDVSQGRCTLQLVRIVILR